MNTILMFLAQLVLTLVACFLLVNYLRPHLVRILVDLCWTVARAKFWAAFSSIVLIVLPAIIGLGYQPGTFANQGAFFDVTNQLRMNLIGFILSLIIIGMVVFFFALVAPRPKENAPRSKAS
jgi:hypothetical protein